MTAIQLRDELNKYIENGMANAEVNFDVEGGAFEVDLVEVNSVSPVIIENKISQTLIVLGTDEPAIHSWKEI